LQAEREEVWQGILDPLLMALFLVVLALLEWVRFIWRIPVNPWLYSGIAVVGVLYVWLRIRPRIELWRQINQGIQGEIHVGHALETLREKGFKVLHDIPGAGWNIDHVIIGPKGIFMIETKTPSKRNSGSKIKYDGTCVLVNGFSPDRDPLIQAKAAAKWLQDFIQRRANRKVQVRPVLIYPNWYIEGKSLGRDVWVENDKTFLKLMESEREKLSQDDVAHISDLLAEYARGDWPES
jgi:hypothetical protein